MPTSAEETLWAVDTSVAVAYLDESHTAHRACVIAVGGRRPALAGHAAFEAYSVLTRLPGGAEVDPHDAGSALEAAFGEPCWLTDEQQSDLLSQVAAVGIRGGAVYDALVAHAASTHARTLLTRDRRAMRTYDLLGAAYELVR